MTKRVLLSQQTENTMNIGADYTLGTTVILLPNPQDFSSYKPTVAEAPFMTHTTVFPLSYCFANSLLNLKYISTQNFQPQWKLDNNILQISDVSWVCLHIFSQFRSGLVWPYPRCCFWFCAPICVCSQMLAPVPQEAAQGAERAGDQARADARRQRERACSGGAGAIQDMAHNRTLAIQI